MIPTTLMGATLPILVRQIQSGARKPSLSRILGYLYSANTLGALFGAFCSGFILLEVFGLKTTNTIALSAALTTGLIALFLASQKTTGSSSDNAIEKTPPNKRNPQSAKLALLIYAVSGFIAMAYEVLWSRTLAIVLGSSTYSFSLVLCSFLGGLSFGGYLVGRLYKGQKNPFYPLMVVFLLLSATSLVTFNTTDVLPELFLELLASTDLKSGTIRNIHFFIAIVTIVPTSIGLGAVMPLAIDASTTQNKSLGTDVGRAYTSNTIGAIVGSLACGFILMPNLGLESTHRLLIILSLTMGLLCYLAKTPKRWLAPLFMIAIALFAWAAKPWDKSKLTTGLFRTHQAADYLNKGGLFDRHVAYYKDGHTTTVTVEDFGHGWVLRNNGKVEASSNHDMPTQILVGLLPVLLHPGLEQRIFMLGYGSGVTVGSMAISPLVASVDVAELEPAVYEAADTYFSKHNHAPQNNPKVKRHVGDGRNILLSKEGTYDVIVSEPSNPWIAGVSTLFTKEFYELAKAKLSPGGVFCQWAQLYELGTPNVKMIYKTFSNSFKYVYAFTPGDQTTDTILIGSEVPLPLSLQEIRKRAQSKKVKDELLRASVEEVTELLASLFLGPDDIPSFTAGAQINTDNNLKLEFAAPKDLLSSASGSELGPLIRSEHWPYGKHSIKQQSYSKDDTFSLAQSYLKYGRFNLAENIYAGSPNSLHKALMTKWIEWLSPIEFSDPEMPLNMENRDFPKPGDIPFKEDKKRGIQAIKALYEAMAEGDWRLAWTKSRNVPNIEHSTQRDDIVLMKAFLEYKTFHFKKALRLLRQLLNNKSDRKALYYYIARSNIGLGRFKEGFRAIKEFDKQTHSHK